MEWLRKEGWPSPSVLLLRHAARSMSQTSSWNDNDPLTPEGEDDAENMGQSLFSYSEIRVYYSPLHRCRETARYIERGARSRGVPSVTVKENPVLGSRYFVSKQRALNLADQVGVERFARLWLDNKMPEGVIVNAKSALDEHLKLIGRALSSSSNESRLSVLITHDWNVLLVRESILSLRHETVGWPGFLEGIAVTREGSSEVRFEYVSQVGERMRILELGPPSHFL